MPTNKKSRTLLCLGPPHSGKSVFCYILFKFLRQLENDACVMDGDYYSPTYRRLRVNEFADPDEQGCVYTTPNAKKLEKLTEENFRNIAHSIHALIENEGVIVVDGLGRHSSSTESLLQLAEILIVLCPIRFDIEHGSEECSYIQDGRAIHPFAFYRNRCQKLIKITTHYHGDKTAYFDENRLEGELYDLDRDVIKKGNIDKIPMQTRDTILRIAEFILANWV